MKTCNQRINNVIGQLSGVKEMMAAGSPDCFKVVVQLKAARSAISSIMEKYLAEEFDSCLMKSSGEEQMQLKKIFAEVIKK